MLYHELIFDVFGYKISRVKLINLKKNLTLYTRIFLQILFTLPILLVSCFIHTSEG